MLKKVIIQIVLILLGVYFVVTSYGISSMGFQGDVLNQRAYVTILAWLLIVFSALSMVVEILKHRRGNESEQLPAASEAEEIMEEMKVESDTKIVKKGKSKVYLSMLLVLLFAYGFSYIGFFVTSFIFVFLITWLMFDWEKKKWIRSLIFSIGLNVVLYILFSLINVYFPKSLLF